MRAPRLDPRLDGRPGVIDVHVHVPQPVTADHDEGLPHRVELAAQRGDLGVGGVEQIHHLEEAAGRVGPVGVGKARLGRQGAPGGSGGDGVRASGGHAAACLAVGGRAVVGCDLTEHLDQGVEQLAQPATPGVDDSGHAQDLELVRSALQRRPGTRGGAPGYGRQAGGPDRPSVGSDAPAAAPAAAAAATDRTVPSTGRATAA